MKNIGDLGRSLSRTGGISVLRTFELAPVNFYYKYFTTKCLIIYNIVLIGY